MGLGSMKRTCVAYLDESTRVLQGARTQRKAAERPAAEMRATDPSSSLSRQEKEQQS